MSEAYQLPDFLEFVFLLIAFFLACKLAYSHHASFTPYFCPILSRYITIFCTDLHRFCSIYCVVVLHHPPALFVIHLYVFCDMLSTISITWWSVLCLGHFTSIDPEISKMQPTLSEFYEIWYACRTSFPDPKIPIFLKIGRVEPKLWVFKNSHFLCSLKQKIHENFGGLTIDLWLN